MTRSLVVLCTLAIGASGCSYFQPQTLPQGLPQTWTRVDGQPIDSAQLEADKTVCRGEMDEANMAAGSNARLHPEVWGYTDGMISVYGGCMAQNGYTVAPAR
jgi:hypothetical protein